MGGPIMNHCDSRFRGLPIVFAGALLLAAGSVRAEPPDMRLRKKLIATGWDHPDCQRLLANSAKMEKRPCDGVVIEVTGRAAAVQRHRATVTPVKSQLEETIKSH